MHMEIFGIEMEVTRRTFWLGGSNAESGVLVEWGRWFIEATGKRSAYRIDVRGGRLA